MKSFFFILVIYLSTQCIAQIPTEGLIAYYPFSGNANDESGYGFNGTNHGAYLTTDRFGNSNSAYYFNGNAYINFPELFSAHQNSFTFSIWFSMANFPSQDAKIIYKGSSKGEVQIHISTNAIFGVKLSNGYWYEVSSNEPIKLNTVYHIVGRYIKGNRMEIWVNGKLANSLPTPALNLFSDITVSSIGAYNLYSYNWYFTGTIDDIRIYNRALSPAEIHSLYREGGWTEAQKNIGNSYNEPEIQSIAQIPTEDLIAYYPFNGNANDESRYGNNGIIYGAVLTTDRFGNQNKAFSFNGIDSYIKAIATNLPSTDRTVSIWFYAYNLHHSSLMGYGGNTCGHSLIMLINDALDPNTYDVQSHCNINRIYYTYSTPPINRWHHFLYTTTSAGSKIYIDGQLKFSNHIYMNNTITNDKDLIIGAAVGINGLGAFKDVNLSYFNGSLDDIRIYSRALSPAEVHSLYHEGGWMGQ